MVPVDPTDSRVDSPLFSAAAWDVAIIGAGPAGSTAALLLARAGHRVLLLDRKSFPREKVCGDGLIRDAIECVKRAGLYDELKAAAHPLEGLRVYAPNGLYADFSGEFWTLERLRLDHLLLRGAMAAGARFLPGEVTGVGLGGAGVEVALKGIGAPIEARSALLTTGADLSLLRRMGLTAPSPPSAIAMRCYVQSKVESRRLVVSFDGSCLPGYAWIFPLGQGRYNVGCGLFGLAPGHGAPSLQALFNSFLEGFPLARELMAKGERISPLKGSPLRCGLEGVPERCRPAARILAAGEVIGTTFPFTGEGIGKAMESGELAAGLLDEALRSDRWERLSDYPALLERELRLKYLGYKKAERWLSKPWVANFVARRAVRSPFLRAALEGILNETANPRRVFSPTTILLSFLR
jgi:geranylgeranyl reductase family protein